MGERPSSLDPSALLLLTLPPLFWASNAIIGRLVVGSIAPLALNNLRWLVAGLLLLPFAVRPLMRHAALIRARWRMLALMGFLAIGCYNSLQYLALQTSTPMNVTLIGSSGPIFILLIGSWFFNERMTARQLAGGTVSMAGVLVVLAHGQLDLLLSLHINGGDLYMLLATLCWSVYTWLLRRHRPPGLPLALMLFVQIAFGVVLFAPLVIAEALSGVTVMHWSWQNGAIVLYVAIFPALLSYFCWDRGVARVGAQLPVFFTNLTPVFAAIMSAFWLGDLPQPYHLVGLVLIIAGIRLAQR
jgi:drug/metabolite transporter (DMT)-like permease